MRGNRQHETIDAVCRNYYSGPCKERLQSRLDDLYLFGTLKITEFEIRESETMEHAFIALLSARLKSTLDDMAALLRAPTLPVHDEPYQPPADD